MTKTSGASGETTPTTENSELGRVISETPRDIKVLVCVPTHGSVKSKFACDLARAVGHFSALPYDGKKEIQVTFVNSTLLPEGRRRLVSQAMSLEATHIMWFDSDMAFPPDTIARLLNHGLAVVACNYPRKNIEARPTAYLDSPDYVGPVWTGEKATGLQEVSVAGMGVMLTDIRVFDNIPLPMFAFEPKAPDYAQDMGEDVYFCRELHKAGIPVHIDHDLSKEISHIGDFEYTNFLSKEAEIVKQALYKDLP